MAIQYNVPRANKIYELRLNRINGGLNKRDYESFIDERQSPDMQNLNADDRGALTKRKGVQKVYTTSLGTGAVNGITYYSGKYVIQYGTKLYTQVSNLQPVEIMTGLTNSKMTFFSFNNILYGINGTDFIQWDGTTAQNIVPYVPTITINRTPSGGGDSNEELNLVGAGFKDSFNGNGADTTYQLSQTSLDATTITVTVGGVAVVEGTGFTANRTAGTLDFSAGSSPHGPPASGTNNVIVTAYKTVAADIASIKNCKYVATFGGENDTRVFLCGNENGYENYVFYSGLLDATYYPANNYNRLGDPKKTITGMAKLYNQLIQFKSNEIYSSTYLEESGTISFPTTLINSSIGCDMPRTIQLINDLPTWCNTLGGVYTLWSNNSVTSERNVIQISENINGTDDRLGLLNESYSLLTAASSYDFGGKYYLCVGNKCWVWDYFLTPFQGRSDGGNSLSWFYYTNINANCWTSFRNDLYFGDRDNGLVRKFHDLYNDDGEPIDAYWKSRLFSFDELSDWYKDILQMWLTTRNIIYSDIDIEYLNELGTAVDTVTISADANLADHFNWSSWDWSGFTWDVPVQYSQVVNKKIKQRDIKYFQLKLSNDDLNENLSIVAIVIQYVLGKKVK